MDEASPYDALLAKHLTSVPEARLFVGDDLSRVHWNGVEEAFGERLVLVPHESILAVYDDSLFGRGTKGFVVTDRHLVLVASGKHLVPLADVTAVKSNGTRLAVTVAGTRLSKDLGFRVDEPPAHATVQAWLNAVVKYNRPAHLEAERLAALGADRLTERQALKRLEKLIERKRLGIDERAWLLRLAEQAQALEAARTGKGKKRS